MRHEQAIRRVLLLWASALLVGALGVWLHWPNVIVPLSAVALAQLLLPARRRPH